MMRLTATNLASGRSECKILFKAVPMLLLFLGIVFISVFDSAHAAENTPDPKKQQEIIFASPKSGSWDIWAMSLGNRELRKLTDTKYIDERFPCYSPSKNEIFYRTNTNCIMRKPDGSEPSSVSNLQNGIKTNPNISPDGKYLAYVNYVIRGTEEDGDIYIADLETGMERKLVELRGHQFNPSWSFDGKYLVFMSGDIRGAYNIWMVSADGTDPKCIVRSDYFDSQPNLSPDNKKVVFCSNRGGSNDIWVSDVETGKLKQLTTNPGADEYPQWSPDGKYILFTSYRDGHFHIWMMNAGGSSQKQLTNGQFNARDGSWLFHEKGANG